MSAGHPHRHDLGFECVTGYVVRQDGNPSMPIFNVSEAKTHFSRLLAQVDAGNDVVIARRGVPVARLVRYAPVGKRQFDAMKGKIRITDAFFEPLPEEELKLWEGG